MSNTFLVLLLKKVEKLSRSDLETLRDKIDGLIAAKPRSIAEKVLEPSQDQRKTKSDESPDRPLVTDGWREEYRKCGKSNCWCAKSEKRHGPYWYRTVREGDRVSKQYWRRGRKKS
jgi:hypothetical protein